MSEHNSKLLSEEIVLWKKYSNNFRSAANEKGLKENDWTLFIQNLRSIAPNNTDVVFNKIPTNFDGMANLFKKVSQILKKYPDFFALSSSYKYYGNAEPVNINGSCTVLLGLNVEPLNTDQTLEEMRRNQDSKLKVLRYLYQIKCREETDEIKIQLQHNKSTLEASELIAIQFIHTPIHPIKVPESKIRQRSNVPMEM